MRIKKLELFGFKSFKDRTVIEFDPGMTGIVGPNGCGKSNIVDALVWVMGEMSAKHLRGANMSDVIFAGSQDYSPMGMCEVSLVLENDGGPFPAKYAKHSEIQLTRRLHRSGESEYLVNKESARLRDIQEVFMDTGAGAKGFSIIAQGSIGELITAKPKDRRRLIEEAAGITKFKVRKRESVRKLQSTEQNLVRLQDIIGEQKRQLGSLERQAQRAERYRKLKNEIKDKELLVTSKQFLSLDEELTSAQSAFDEAQASEVGTASDIDQLQSTLQELKLKVVEKEKIVEDRQIQSGEAQKRVQELEHEIRELRFEIEQARRDKEKTGSISEQYMARKQALDADKQQVETRLLGVKEMADKLTADYTEKNDFFENINERAVSADEELTQKRKELLTTSQAESHLEAQIQSRNSQVEELRSRFEQSGEVLMDLKQKHSEFEQHRNSVFKKLEEQKQLQLGCMKDVDTFEENITLLAGQIDEKETEVEKFKEELNEVSGKLYGLEDLQSNFEGFEQGVKSVMLWQRERVEHADGSVSFQPMSELIEVPQKYEMAMEAALGTRLQMLVADSNENTLNAVNYLKENNSGRSSFLTQDANNGAKDIDNPTIKSEEGFENLLYDVVKVPEAQRSQVSVILKDIVVVDSIRTALRMRGHYEGKTFVTLDGDTLTGDGVLTGGSADSAESGVLKRKREIKEFSQRREEWAGKLALAQAALGKLRDRHSTLSREFENAKKKSSEQEILVVELKKDLERSEQELNNAEGAVSRQQNDLSVLEAQLLRMEEDTQTQTEKLTELKENKLAVESRVEELTEELRLARDGVDELQETVTQLKVESAQKTQELDGLYSQLEMVNKSLAEVTTELDKMDEESMTATNSLSSNSVLVEQRQVELENLIHKAKELEGQLSLAKDEFEQSYESTREIEEKVNNSNRALNDYKARINETQLKLEQLKMKELFMTEQMQERYMVDLREVAPGYRDQECDVEKLDAEVEELKKKIGRIGEVNLSAIEEYDDLSERYKFLSQQHEDLIAAKEQLRKVIDRINRICTRRFKETFELVNERFQKVFPVLFGGGEAKLILIEDEEKGEMGVDIVAKPPGKKPQSVGLLSGGEKALTAVSLIFSIFLVKPSPFCLLDEVDAPLDDANVVRFNDLVREMAKRSQIIVVTHNKHTMKVNNKLYGVTQEERGVSKMVSVDFEKATNIAQV